MARYNYNFDKVDSWYRYKGVIPPSRTPMLTEEELHQSLKENFRNHVCEYGQTGNQIFCDIGENRHGKFIGTKLRLDSTVNGEPILVPHGPIFTSDLQGA